VNVWVQLVFLVFVIVFAIIGFIWDRRYRGEKDGNFKPTNEVFKDPATGKLTRVYEDPATGQRQYKDEL